MTPTQREAALRLISAFDDDSISRINDLVVLNDAIELLRELAAEPEPNPLAGTMAEAFLNVIATIWHEHPDYSTRQTLDALNAMFPVAEPQGEPVAWLYESASGSSFLHRGFTNVRFEADMRASKEYPDGHKMTPLYIHPPQQRKPLSDDALADIITSVDRTSDDLGPFFDVGRAVEAAHDIKGETE